MVSDGFSPTSPAPTNLPVVVADDPVPDVLRQSARMPAVALPASGPGLRVYRGLDLRECVGIAALNSPLASALQAKRSALSSAPPRCHLYPGKSRRQADRLLATALALELDEVRNQDAAKVADALFASGQAQAQEAVARRALPRQVSPSVRPEHRWIVDCQ